MRLYVVSGSHSWGSDSSNNTGCIKIHRNRSIVIPVLASVVRFVVVAVITVTVEKTILGKVVAQIPYVQITQRRNSIFSVP